MQPQTLGKSGREGASSNSRLQNLMGSEKKNRWRLNFTARWAGCLHIIKPSSSSREEDHPPAERFLPERGQLYSEWFVYKMSVQFPRIQPVDLRNALHSYGESLCRAYRAVAIAYNDAERKERMLPISKECREQQSVDWPPIAGLTLTKNPTLNLQCPPTPCPLFEEQWSLLKTDFSEHLKEDCSLPPLQTFECGCCCMDYDFQMMVQCADGHLFCGSCLQRQVEELTFGGLQACGSILCMHTGGCEQFFPWSEVQRAVPKDLLVKFEQRQAADSVAQASLSGLVHCPSCEVACEVDEGKTVFHCPNEPCLKTSCILCKEPDHLPLTCKEVEKPSDTCLRVKIEEIMSKALIRECSRCKAQIVKEDGCNKVTCRCGQTMCYICRKQGVTYRHFCAHYRKRRKSACTVCKQTCCLHDMEDPKSTVIEAKKAALKDIARKDPAILVRQIGPAED